MENTKLRKYLETESDFYIFGLNLFILILSTIILNPIKDSNLAITTWIINPFIIHIIIKFVLGVVLYGLDKDSTWRNLLKKLCVFGDPKDYFLGYIIVLLAYAIVGGMIGALTVLIICSGMGIYALVFIGMLLLIYPLKMLLDYNKSKFFS